MICISDTRGGILGIGNIKTFWRHCEPVRRLVWQSLCKKIGVKKSKKVLDKVMVYVYNKPRR